MNKWKKPFLFPMFCLAFVWTGGCGKEDGVELYQAESFQQEEIIQEVTETPAIKETLWVYVCGAVVSPGVYELPMGARAFEAIERAGGLTVLASEKAVNQAAALQDGQQLYVPTKGEESQETESLEAGLVNLNTADAQELTTLPGIGDARAGDIIAYREEHGGFSSIEEIQNVNGIKDALFQKIKDKIKV